MNLAAIRAWLASGQDFAQGAALYAEAGASATFKHLFALGATEYSCRVLLRELRALGDEPMPAGSAPAALPAPPASPPPAAPTASPAAAPPEAAPLLGELAQQLKAVRDERSHLHPQLTASGLRRAARFRLCVRIVKLTDQEVELLAQQAYVQQHGRLPGPVPLAQVTDAGELRRRLTNLRSQRSKLQHNPARAADLARVQTDIDYLTQQLALPRA